MRSRDRRGRPARITDSDYARLLAVRTALRRFEHWSAEQAAGQGLTASQHQLLLAVRGHSDSRGPTIREVAQYLLIRHHSAVELCDRTQAAGLLTRQPDADDHRVVRLELTRAGARALDALSAVHLDELANLAMLFETLIGTLANG